MKAIKSFSVGLVFFVVSSCGSLNPMNPLGLLAGNSWALSTLLGKSLDLSQFTEGVPSLNFLEGGKLAGFTGCNNLSRSFALEGSSIKLDPGAVTRKSCPGTGEQDFLDALSKVGSLKIGKDKLTFLDGEEELMSFIPKED